MKTRTKKSTKPRKVSFDDMEAVAMEMVKVLDLGDPSDVSIRPGSAPNGFGTAYRIATHGDRQEYYVMRNEDEFEAAALQGVRDQLVSEPEMFTQSWLESFIDVGRLGRELHSDVLNMNEESLREEGIDEDEIEDKAEAATREQLRDPVEYLRDIYSSDTMKEAIKIAGIDVEKAAHAAIRDDGAAHFMCSYDGNYETSPSGFVYWRHN